MPNADEIGLYDHDEDDDGEDMDMDLMEDTSDEDEDEDEDEMSEDDNVETEILNMGSTVPDSDDESIDLTPIKKVSEPKPKPSKPSKAAVKVVKASKPIKSKSVEKKAVPEKKKAAVAVEKPKTFTNKPRSVFVSQPKAIKSTSDKKVDVSTFTRAVMNRPSAKDGKSPKGFVLPQPNTIEARVNTNRKMTNVVSPLNSTVS
ncbi:MAG: hypothetical protein CL961_00260 [Euryarchaeota archaeon]|nr:hypothetical protein [Euryarchaeota archaeon]|tara:strand:- start:3993 stop:4598 length:606 start_codon:yes stop_codon:yes gene_type:complete